MIALVADGITAAMRELAIIFVCVLSSTAFAAPVKPTVTIDTPEITGTYDAKVVTAVLKRSESSLLACYTKALAKDSGLEGSLNIAFTIGTTGKVTDAGAAGINDDVEKCVQKVIAKLAFAKPKQGAVDVTVTLDYGNATLQNGAFASLTGTGDISSGFDDANIYGGLLGNQSGDAVGKSGFGPGGGGTGWGTIGTGRYGTIGHGSGTSSGYGTSHGRLGRTAAVPTISLGQATVTGELDKAIIRRYIKRNIQKLAYCYEKQLLAKPGLQGTVIVEFTIAPAGTVSASSASGVDEQVSGCVADVVKGIEFPKPKQDDVKVKYPLIYRPAGDDAVVEPAKGPAPSKPDAPKPDAKK